MKHQTLANSQIARLTLVVSLSIAIVSCTKRIEIRESQSVQANTASNARNIVGKTYSETDFKDDKPIREETVESNIKTAEPGKVSESGKATSAVTAKSNEPSKVGEPAKVIYYQSGASVQVKDGVIVAHMRDAVAPMTNSGIPEPSVDETSIQYWRHKFKGEEVEDIKRTDMCDVHQHCTSELKTKNGQSIFYSPETGYVERIFEYAKEQ